ncbi:hypothetical protein PYJP_04050 [Pyrofollis japonicus]|uniref:hypothetical protein n=1 Tax=Pyrofollis japonicus TaxID=3060460 RepID=UPI00295B2B84|nr:hypothetical protein [Pyrofollis japonicus]BEP17053.1 hypothetical protein PYJP_04050 [Pyrofollis japonicus]
MPVRFYAQGAPSWWKYQLVSLANQRLPSRKLYFYDFLVDNGMFNFYKRGERPLLDRWLEHLKRFVLEIDIRYKPENITIILPDWLHDPAFTLKAATHFLSRMLCKDYECLLVVHSSPSFGGYSRAALEAASIPWATGLAAPLKLNCSRTAKNRRVIKLHCQQAIVEQVCSIASRHGLSCHGLGVALKPDHIKRLVGLGLTSFDSSSWTRPNSSIIEKMLGGRWSAKNSREKDLFMKVVLQRLSREVELEGVERTWSKRI